MSYYQAEIFVEDRKGNRARHYRLVKAATSGAAIRQVSTYCEQTWPSGAVTGNKWSFVVHETIGEA